MSATEEKQIVLAIEMADTPIGGVQSVMATLLSHLRRDFRPVIMVCCDNPDLCMRMRQAGVEVVVLPVKIPPHGMGGRWFQRKLQLLNALPHLLRVGWFIRTWIQTNRPAVVFITRLPYLRLFALLLPDRGFSFFYHAHGFTNTSDIPPSAAKLINRRVHRVLAVSKITRDWLVKAGVRGEKIAVVYNGIDIDVLRLRALELRHALPPRLSGEIVFVHVGHVTANKGQHVAIEALARLSAETKTRLWLCGDVPGRADPGYLSSLKSLVLTLGVSERVHFLGWRDDIPAVLAAADVCILPSQQAESFGMVLAEAMSLGKACIGTSRGGVPEVVQDGVTGFVVEPTVEAFHGAMALLASDCALRARMGFAGRERVDRFFTAARQAEAVSAEIRNTWPAGRLTTG